MILAVENVVKQYSRRFKPGFRLEASFTVEQPAIVGVMGPTARARRRCSS